MPVPFNGPCNVLTHQRGGGGGELRSKYIYFVPLGRGGGKRYEVFTLPTAPPLDGANSLQGTLEGVVPENRDLLALKLQRASLMYTKLPMQLFIKYGAWTK